MATETAVASPAADKSGDGQAKASANLTRDDAVAFFMKPKDETPKTPKTADKSAPEAQSPTSEESPAAEPAQADSPEASPQPEASPEAKEGQADDALSQESQQQPPEETELDEATRAKLAKIVKGRMDKETVKRKQIEGQLAQEIAARTKLENQLKAAAQQQQQVVPAAAPMTDAPLPDIKDPAALVAYRKQVKSAIENVETLLDSEAIESGQPVEYNGQTYTKAELRANRRTFQKLLDDSIPAQQEFFQQQTQREQRKQQIYQTAIQEFPVLAKPAAEAPEVAQAVQFLRNVNPAILDAPEASWIVGLLVEGANALAARKNPVKAPETAQETKPEQKTETKVAQKKAPTDQAAVSAPASPRPSPGNLQRAPQVPKGNLTADGAAALLASLANSRGR